VISKNVWVHVATFVYGVWRPPKVADLSVRNVLRTRVRRMALLVVIVPLGLGLVALTERYPSHPVVRLSARAGVGRRRGSRHGRFGYATSVIRRA
jgi:hypothetical protein